MNNLSVLGLIGVAAIVAGCATSPGEPPMAGTGACDATAAQHFVGDAATQSLAASALQLTGARELRWIPENSAVTMDYRADRLNIEFDSNRTVTAIRCG